MKTKFAMVILAACLLPVTTTYAQIKTLSNQAVGGVAPEYVGWNGLGGNDTSLDIQNKFHDQNIVFYTNPNASGTTATKKMIIIGSSDSTDGFVGIGTIVPVFRLNVIDTTSLFYDARFGRTTTTAGYFVSANPDATSRSIKCSALLLRVCTLGCNNRQKSFDFRACASKLI